MALIRASLTVSGTFSRAIVRSRFVLAVSEFSVCPVAPVEVAEATEPRRPLMAPSAEGEPAAFGAGEPD